MRHIGLFGGTFNPVHSGHLLAAEAVYEQLDLDEIRFLPAAHSPFKPKPDISDQHRLAMLKLALADHPEFTIDPRELDRAPPSYTIDTLRSISASFPQDRYYLIIGMDAWQSFEEWRTWRSILDLCHLVVVTRPGYKPDALPSHWKSRLSEHPRALRTSAAGRLIFIDVPPSEAASSTLRNSIEQQRSTDNMLHPAVRHYIDEQKLYRGKRAPNTPE